MWKKEEKIYASMKVCNVCSFSGNFSVYVKFFLLVLMPNMDTINHTRQAALVNANYLTNFHF